MEITLTALNVRSWNGVPVLTNSVERSAGKPGSLSASRSSLPLWKRDVKCHIYNPVSLVTVLNLVNLVNKHPFHSLKTHFNPLNPELNPICYLLALLGAHHFLHVTRIRVKSLTFRLLMSYVYGAPTLDVSRSHTTTQHGR